MNESYYSKVKRKYNSRKSCLEDFKLEYNLNSLDEDRDNLEQV